MCLMTTATACGGWPLTSSAKSLSLVGLATARCGMPCGGVGAMTKIPVRFAGQTSFGNKRRKNFAGVTKSLNFCFARTIFLYKVI